MTVKGQHDPMPHFYEFLLLHLNMTVNSWPSGKERLLIRLDGLAEPFNVAHPLLKVLEGPKGNVAFLH